MNRFLLSVFILFSAGPASAQITMERTNGGLLFLEGNEKVLFYNIEPKSIEGNYSRCNYLHPLWGPDGTVLTEDFPADHLHHRGIFWAWHQVWIGDKRIGDPWEIRDFHQCVTSTGFANGKDGSGQLTTEVDWLSPAWKKAGEEVPYLKENTRIVIHPKQENYRKIDFEISLLALAENLRIGGSEDVKGYSGFSVRMVLPEDVTFEGPDGIVAPQNEAVSSPGYVNISGSLLQQGKGGIVMADHRQNPGYPQSWILRSQRSMQNAAWPGNTTVAVSTKSPLILRYSVIVYSGQLSGKQISRILSDPAFQKIQ